MMIESLRQHWPARKTEWLMMILVGAWGSYMLMHPAMFTDPATAQPLSGLARIAYRNGATDPSLFWGGIALAAALGRGAALFVNGAYARTPIGRLVAAFVSMFIFTQVSVGLYQSGVPNLGLIVYPWLVAVDVLSAYRAGQDAVYAEVQRRSQIGAMRASAPYARAE